MRILQIIDSLEIGGAERMAINYANALSRKIEFSGIVATRKEGNLKCKIEDKVSYYFLNRKSKIDIPAIFKLRKICIENKITHLQAHSSSFFISVLVKFALPKINIIWHDHNGLSEFINTQNSFVLKIASHLFTGIVVVNDTLKKWAEKELNCKKIIYLPNFTSIENDTLNSTKLLGIEGKKILCLANLRFQKNHFFLINVAKEINEKYPEWSFHLIGKDFEDDYSKKIREKVILNNLESNIFIYGSKSDVLNIINQSDIAILTSQSEGLPVAILEYGLNKKPLVTTNVGELPSIIQNGINGFISDKKEIKLFADNLIKLIEDKNLRKVLGENLFKTISEIYSEANIIDNYLSWLNKKLDA